MVTSIKKYLFFIFSLLMVAGLYAQPINRKALVQRHRVLNSKFDPLSPLTVGNGSFAFTVDVTGLQSFPEVYAKGIPLGTQSEWGWHSFADTAGYRFEETLKDYNIHGRMIPYPVQIKSPEHSKNAVNWFRENPHRLQLGNIGMEIILKDGTAATINDIHNIHQVLNLWTGEIHSTFTVENVPVEVITYGHQQEDAVACSIHSPLIKKNRLHIRIRFPYPSGDFKDAAAFYGKQDKHESCFISDRQGGLIRRVLDTTQYEVAIQWNSKANLQQKQKHDFIITPEPSDSFQLVCRFSSKHNNAALPGFTGTAQNSKSEWKKFWLSGGAIDFSGTADKRAFELERRIVLSQYLTKIQCSGDYPPQETGLTYNSWYGKPHLEMHWWHAVHFALWGRTDLMEKSLAWYATVADEAKKIAERQGYQGIRWQKMTDNNGKESPSSVGSFLIWQQPHFIYLAEQVYQDKHDVEKLNRYKDLVFATADFMASYAYFDSAKQKYILGNGLIPAQERFRAEETFNPTYELVYWYWALNTAQQWRERLHLARKKEWDEVISKLSPLPVQDNKYLFTESGTDSYSNPEYRKDHPSVLGAFGMLPQTPMLNPQLMRNTFNWIMNNWTWKDTWGWDFPMMAMTAVRLGMPDEAVNALLMPVQKNTYLNNGHNYQDDRLTLYLPGNGGLLTAVALMCAGYEGSRQPHPGIPAGWKLKWEGLHKMF